MIDPFERAESCRRRAAELRDSAARAAERETCAVLLALAEALEQHARSLEVTILKLGSARRAAVPEAAD